MSKYWQLDENATYIPDNVDMHTYLTPGNYKCTSSARATTLKNCPVSDAFTMKVYYGNGSAPGADAYIIQEYTLYNGKRRVLSVDINGSWSTYEYATKDDLPNMFSSTVPTDWTNINNDNAPLSIWNIGTEGTWFKGAPDGAYRYGTLIFLGGNLNKGDWRNVLIYIPDIVTEKSIYVRNERGSTWLKLTGTTVNSVT